MTDEPDFILQERGAKTPFQAREWLELQAGLLRRNGAELVRASHHDLQGDERLWLLEGWRQRPKDQGDPRFWLPPVKELPLPIPAGFTNEMVREMTQQILDHSAEAGVESRTIRMTRAEWENSYWKNFLDVMKTEKTDDAK